VVEELVSDVKLNVADVCVGDVCVSEDAGSARSATAVAVVVVLAGPVALVVAPISVIEMAPIFIESS